MLISKSKKEHIIKKIISKDCKVIYLNLNVGKCGLYDLEDIISIMFNAWKRMSKSKLFIFDKYFTGFLRRFVVLYDNNTGLYIPCFIFICVMKKNLLINDYKIKIMIYIYWLSAWVTSLRFCTNANIKWQLISLEKVQGFINRFFSIPELNVSNKETESFLQSILNKHKLYSFSGLFKNMIDIEIVNR